jgi:hypothetical protein
MKNILLTRKLKKYENNSIRSTRHR